MDTRWYRRHRTIQTLLWLQGIAVWAYALRQGNPFGQAVTDAAPAIASAALATLPDVRRVWRSATAAVGFLAGAVAFVYLSGGAAGATLYAVAVVASISAALYRAPRRAVSTAGR